MKISGAVDPNILAVYREDSAPRGEGIRAEELDWDAGRAPRLAQLCVLVLAEHWTEYPVSELPLERDLQLLLGALNPPVPAPPGPPPLALLVARVHCDSFWERVYRSRWPSGQEEGRPFLQLYLERHCEEYLQNLMPSDYDPEKISELVAVCGERVQRLRIQGLMAGDFLQEAEHQTLYRDTIPLGSVLSGLAQLSELRLDLRLRAAEYCRSLGRLAPRLARRLAAGLRACARLAVLRIISSDIDCDKLKVILDALDEHGQLRLLELSHGHVGDRGALHLASFLLRRPSLRELLLVNNDIGPSGASALSYALQQPSCRLLALDLRCNTSLRAPGLTALAAALHRGTSLHRLNVSACGVGAAGECGAGAGRLLAAALAAGRSPLRELDVSVNNLGPETGAALMAALLARGSGGPAVLAARAAGLGRWEAALARHALRTAARRRAAAQRFRRGAARLLQAKRVARAIGIGEVDPLRLARQLTARPSAASLPLSLSLSLSLDGLEDDAAPPPSVHRDMLRVEVPLIQNPFAPHASASPQPARRPSYHGSEHQGRAQLLRTGSADALLGRPTAGAARPAC